MRPFRRQCLEHPLHRRLPVKNILQTFSHCELAEQRKPWLHLVHPLGVALLGEGRLLMLMYILDIAQHIRQFRLAADVHKLVQVTLAQPFQTSSRICQRDIIIDCWQAAQNLGAKALLATSTHHAVEERLLDDPAWVDLL